MVSFVSCVFISALIFKSSFLLLTLGFLISSFSICFRCRVTLFIWLFSCFLRYACIAMNFPLSTAFTVSHSLSEFREMVMNKEAWRAAIHGVAKSRTRLSNWTELKQGDNIQPWRAPFRILNKSVVPCPVLTVASWSAYRFLRRQVRWSGIPIYFRISYSLMWATQSKALA